MKVAIVHDLLLRFGGAERVVLALKEIFPDAPIYTLLYDQQKMMPWFADFEVRTSWLQKTPSPLRRRHRYLLNLMPLGVESFDLRSFDLVISSSTAFAKGVITRPRAKHICYCHSPARFLWDATHWYFEKQNLGWLKRQVVMRSIHKLRLWDKSSAKRVDWFVANSETTQRRIEKFYRRSSRVIYPPVPDLERELQKTSLWNSESAKNYYQKNDYFLIVSQLAPHKGIEVAVEAFNKLELPLLVVGEGPEKEKLVKLAGPTVKLLGFLPEKEVWHLLKNCKAFVFPGEDDFGMAPVQAAKCGKPVLALRAGGATETVREGETGEFFDWPLPEVLADGARRLLENYQKYDQGFIRQQATRFSKENFNLDFKKLLLEILEK